MNYSKYPREAYAWTTSTGNVVGIGKILANSSPTAWNLACLLVDIEAYAHKSHHLSFEPEWVGKAVATDRIMEEEDRLDEWLALAKLTPLTFMYRFMKSEVFEIFPAEAIEHAFNRAELLEAEFRPVVDLARLIFRLRTGSAKPGRSVGS